MSKAPTDKSFVTEKRLSWAATYANELAEREPWLSGAECAEKAVRRIFGRWLQDWTAAVRPEYLPLYFQLISKIENRLGLHRVLRRHPAPSHPLPQRSPMPLPQRAALAV